MVPLGIQEAVCSLVGNCIGANNVPLAKRFFSFTMKVTIALILMIVITTVLARRQLAMVFTDDEQLIEMTAPLILLAGLNFFADGFQGYLQGPIRAMGLQQVASYIALASYWLIALPLAIIFCFVCDVGVSGLLKAIMIGAACQCLSYLSLLICTNW